MGQYLIRRLLTAIPTIIIISFIIFLILDMAPGDPTASLPMTIPQEVREQIRESLGLGQPFHIRYGKFMKQFFWSEPLNILEDMTGAQIGDPNRLRLRSWQTRSPVIDLITDRTPQTLWVVGLSYVIAVLLAIPLGTISAIRQYSIFDQLGTVFSIIGYSVPTFFTGLLLIIIFSVRLGWFPSYYDTTLVVHDWPSFVKQLKQMIMPVSVLALYQTAAISRYTRSAVLDNLKQDYVRTAYAKGFREHVVVVRHVLRNSLIPVITLIALGIPQIFAGAIITEQIFRVNGLGELLIRAIQGSDVPLVMTLTLIFAILIVFFNLIADIIYGILDPRIRYG
ncbi:MAG: ABC transporter permease [Caldilineaceae bacterium]|nr:ABC transporter permease [Caldilineaceae bacterium]